MDLSGPSLPPASGKPPRTLVVLLHGYGADGNDLIGLAPHWAKALPDTLFLSPHAPFPCEASPVGRQWFGFQGKRPDMVAAEFGTAALILDRFLDAILARHRLDERRLALVGFSQGAMMALHVGLRRPSAPAGIVSYSGMLPAPERLAAEIRVRPPVLLVHGDQDPVIPPDALPEAEAALEATGVPIRSELRPGLAHGIDEHGLVLGARFLVEVLAEAPAANR
jgi:phospholipase/carboxylesterase